MKKIDRPILAAFQFLSRFPVRAELDFEGGLLRRSVKYYPLVGFAIGLAVWAAAILASMVMPPLPAAVITLLVWVWLTGGLHLDGFMDSADALLSYRTREKMLEIMKDSRVGAMGVLACVLWLLLKVSLIYSLLAHYDAGPLGIGLLTAPIWSRAFMAYAMRFWPKAREGGGLAGHFLGLGKKDITLTALISVLLTMGSLLLVVLSFYIVPAGERIVIHWLSYIIYLVVHPVMAWVAGSIIAGRMSSKLGGLTGDTYGALNEILETGLLLVAVVIFL